MTSMVATALLTAGCATTPAAPTTGSASPIPVGTDQPDIVKGYLTSALDERPYTAEELTDPETRSIVEQCERAGNRGCRYNVSAKDRKRTFARDTDTHVIARFHMRQLAAGRPHTSACQFVDPSGSVVSLSRETVTLPRGWKRDSGLSYTCSFPLDSTLPTGTWAVHFLTNGESAAVLKFDLVGSAGERSV